MSNKVRHLNLSVLNHFSTEMFSYASKLKLKDLFLAVGEEELVIENTRQQLANLPEFEPYAAF